MEHDADRELDGTWQGRRRWHLKRAAELRQQADNPGVARILAESHEMVAARLADRLAAKGGK